MPDRIEPSAVAISLGVLVVGGVVGAVWDTIGYLMKSGLAVSVLSLPLLFRSTHRQSVALARHINESPSTQLSTVSLYKGMRTLSELTARSRVDATLPISGVSTRSEDVARGRDGHRGVGRLEVSAQGPRVGLHYMVRVSAEPTDVHNLIAGDDCALVGFYSVYGPGNLDYSPARHAADRRRPRADRYPQGAFPMPVGERPRGSVSLTPPPAELGRGRRRSALA